MSFDRFFGAKDVVRGSTSEPKETASLTFSVAVDAKCFALELRSFSSVLIRSEPRVSGVNTPFLSFENSSADRLRFFSVRGCGFDCFLNLCEMLYRVLVTTGSGLNDLRERHTSLCSSISLSASKSNASSVELLQTSLTTEKLTALLARFSRMLAIDLGCRCYSSSDDSRCVLRVG